MAARAAILLGTLSVLAVPAAVVAAQFSDRIDLLPALYVGAPVSVALGLLALLASRRSRAAAARTLNPRSAGPVRSGRFAAWAGLYVGVTAAMALGVYGVLVWAQ